MLLRYFIRRYQFELTIGGLVVLVAGALIITVVGAFDYSRIHIETSMSGAATATIFPTVASVDPPPLEPYRVVVKGRVSAPLEASLDDGFLVRVEFFLKEITDQSGTHIDDGMRASAEEEIRRQLASDLRATLSLAGMTVKPEDPTSVSQQLITNWSVKPNAPGKHIGIVKTALERMDHPFKRNPVLVDLPGEMRLEVNATKPRRGLMQYAGMVASVTGFAAMAAGLVEFFWTWADRRRKRRDEETKRKKGDEENKPKIHLP